MCLCVLVPSFFLQLFFFYVLSISPSTYHPFLPPPFQDANSIYEPDARHWLKIKKDYLAGMADSADLMVIGAYFGSGNKVPSIYALQKALPCSLMGQGGLLSVFLMGTYDSSVKKWKTVCKVGNGHDDATLAKLQGELIPKMTKISQDYDRLPSWIICSRTLVPDYVMTDPKKHEFIDSFDDSFIYLFF